MDQQVMYTPPDVVNVLIVEDDEDDFFIAKRLLQKARTFDCQATRASTYEEGIEALSSGEYDICLADYRLGARDGLELLREIDERGTSTPVILLTGQGDLETDISAMAAGAADYLVKDEIDPASLERSIRYALERQRAQQRIREQAALLDKARDAISAHDLEGRVLYWNKSAERLTGYSQDEMQGETILPLLKTEEGTNPEDLLRPALKTVLAEEEWTGELTLQPKDGDEVIVESRWSLVRDEAGKPKSILVINTDITERKELETQFMRSQRMESIGRLVGGIAHDLGNLLMPIILGVKTLRQRMDDEQALGTLSMIQNSAERGANMVEQVLAFARGVEGEHKALDLKQVVAEVERMTSETFPDSISVDVRVEGELPEILADPTQIQQVLMNLCVNARDALDGGGCITIRAESCHVDEELSERLLEAAPGRYLKVEVLDDGPGIPPEVRDKVFEPFFTTKDSGEGTGLGLSTVYSIVKSHDGFIDLESKVGEGTCFKIYLPLAEVDEEPSAPEQEELPPLESGQGEGILIIDDEEYVVDSLKETLREAGYRPLVAQSGEDALALIEERAEEIDAVVTDLMMPGLDGHEVIRTIREQHPEWPIIVSSGVSSGQPDQALEAGADEFLSKPYSGERLCRTLQGVLRREQAPSAPPCEEEPATLEQK